MECERIIEEIREHALARIKGVETARGCRIALPLLEPSGDVITVTVEQRPEPGTYFVTDGGRLNGLLFESSPAGPSAPDRSLMNSIAERAELTFDHDRRVFYATAIDKTLGYWTFEVGRSIATLASMVPQHRRSRTGRRLSTYVIAQLQRELMALGLLGRMRGRRRIRGITNVERRVDFSYHRTGAPFGGGDYQGDVFVIAADLRVQDPLKPAQDTMIAAHDLSALDDGLTIRIVHGVVGEGESLNGAAAHANNARRLIESVASSPGIEAYAWDNESSRAAFVEATVKDLATVPT